MGTLTQVRRYLVCPDDSRELLDRAEGLECVHCHRWFPFDGEVIHLLPKGPLNLPPDAASADYIEFYRRQFLRLSPSPDPVAWGAPEVLRSRDLGRKRRHVQWVLQLLSPETDVEGQVFCDLSSGAGYYTFEAARVFRLVLHCDLDIDSLAYASRKAKERGVKNIAFLRIDYLQPPFASTIDRMICLDTLVRGKGHERLLLESIRKSLAPGGWALVDFHNWWHNPLRRLGLLPNNFGTNTSYTRRGAESLLRNAGYSEWGFLPFHQECPAAPSLRWLARNFIPATRLTYRIRADVSGSGSVGS